MIYCVFFILLEITPRYNLIPSSDDFWMRHPIVVTIHVQNKRGIIKSKEFSNSYEINSEGFVDRDYTIDKNKKLESPF